MNGSPLGISKKIAKHLFRFLTYKLFYAKNRFFAYFCRRRVEAAANNLGRFHLTNLKGL
jgi:hypothetical protein